MCIIKNDLEIEGNKFQVQYRNSSSISDISIGIIYYPSHPIHHSYEKAILEKYKRELLNYVNQYLTEDVELYEKCEIDEDWYITSFPKRNRHQQLVIKYALAHLKLKPKIK